MVAKRTPKGSGGCRKGKGRPQVKDSIMMRIGREVSGSKMGKNEQEFKGEMKKIGGIYGYNLFDV